VYEEGKGALPSFKKDQQLIDMFRRGRDLPRCALMNVMKAEPKMALSIGDSELRKLEVRVEQTDDALGSVRGDHCFDLGEWADDDLHGERS
jgi:hypothetical protein